MFEKLKTFFSGLSYAWKYGDVFRSVTLAWSQFPGWEDSELLRLWIRPLVIDYLDKNINNIDNVYK
jgi:hypothetical protein